MTQINKLAERGMRCKSCGRVAAWLDKDLICGSPKCMKDFALQEAKESEEQ